MAESSQSKRTPAYSQDTAISLSEVDVEELYASLPPGKKLKVGREYLQNRKSKRTEPYWGDFIDHKGEAIGKAVETCLEHWGIEDKLFTVTVDNASSNDVACMHLSRMIRRTGCINEGKNLHVRCMAHIINLIVWDGIKQHGVCIYRVRNAMKHVKNSPAKISRFKDLVQKANIDSKASLSFDVHTRWNSTFRMLDTALKFQRVFSGLSLPDGEDLNDNERPSEEEYWKKVQRLTLFLKGFYVLTKRIFGSHYVTSNKGLSEIASMYNILNKWEKSGDLNFQAIAITMKQKFDKYWGNVNKMKKLIYVDSIRDPHCKFILVELSLINMHGKKKGSKLPNEVKDFTYTLFDEYRNMYTSSISQKGGDDYMKNLKEVAKKLEGTSGYVMNELDRFLHERIGPEEEELDALTWWGINGHRYPVLKCMARDILAVPLSIVASESAFSTGGCTLDPFWSSLTSKLGMFYNYSYADSDNTSFGFDVRVIDNPVFRTKPSFPHEYKIVLFMNPNCEIGHPRLDDFMVVELSNEIALIVKSVKSGEKRKVQAEKIDAHVFALPSDRRLSQSATRVDKSELYCSH
uniref:Transposase n=1 Tax=Chenopodium quinoa TaxID=63459 RepID=A0A803NCA3_CHEQI